MESTRLLSEAQHHRDILREQILKLGTDVVKKLSNHDRANLEMVKNHYLQQIERLKNDHVSKISIMEETITKLSSVSAHSQTKNHLQNELQHVSIFLL